MEQGQEPSTPMDMPRSGLWSKSLREEMLPCALQTVDLGQNLLEHGPVQA